MAKTLKTSRAMCIPGGAMWRSTSRARRVPPASSFKKVNHKTVCGILVGGRWLGERHAVIRVRGSYFAGRYLTTPGFGAKSQREGMRIHRAAIRAIERAHRRRRS